MVANTNAGLQRIMERFDRTSRDYGMKINIKKTKVMRISRVKGRKLTIIVDGQKSEQVAQFCYLGSIITEDCKCHKEIKRRIAIRKERSITEES
jgi:hypothetical protein